MKQTDFSLNDLSLVEQGPFRLEELPFVRPEAFFRIYEALDRSRLASAMSELFEQAEVLSTVLHALSPGRAASLAEELAYNPYRPLRSVAAARRRLGYDPEVWLRGCGFEAAPPEDLAEAFLRPEDFFPFGEGRLRELRDLWAAARPSVQRAAADRAATERAFRDLLRAGSLVRVEAPLGAEAFGSVVHLFDAPLQLFLRDSRPEDVVTLYRGPFPGLQEKILRNTDRRSGERLREEAERRPGSPEDARRAVDASVALLRKMLERGVFLAYFRYR